MSRGGRTFKANDQVARLVQPITCEICGGATVRLLDVQLGKSAFSPAYHAVICAECWADQVQRLGLNELAWRIKQFPG